jgi:hypothetical protein
VFDPPPEIYPEWVWVLEGFEDVSTDRQLGMGSPGPVPFSSIVLWAEIEGLGSEEFRTFKRLIGELDGEYADHYAERSKAPRG